MLNTSASIENPKPSSSFPRCVALCPRLAAVGAGPALPSAAALPEELTDLLAQRGARVECFSDALAALAALVVLERGFSRGEHRDPMLLILVEPSRLRDAERLVVSASKYAHHAAVWQYEAASERRLSRYTAPVGAAAHAPNPVGPVSGGGFGVAGGNRAGVPKRPGAGLSRAGGGLIGNGVGTSGGSGGSFVVWGGVPGNVTSLTGAPSGSGVTAGPKLRLTPVSGGTTEPGRSQEPTAPAGRPGGGIMKPELSDEEIAMLLDDQPVAKRDPASGGVIGGANGAVAPASPTRPIA